MIASRGRNSIVFLAIAILVGVGLAIGTSRDARGEDAPSSPGNQSTWPSAVKEFLGTSFTDECRVYFTGAEGIVTEVFYPTLDQPQQTDLQLLVLDTAGTWGADDAEERKQNSVVSLIDKRSLTWTVTTTAKNGKWRTSKKIFTDPNRSTLIERVTFETLEAGKTVSDYNVYVLNNPAINRTPFKDNSRTLTHSGRIMLAASEPLSTSSALAISRPWKKQDSKDMVSSGFVGRNDGWSDLFAGTDDRTMDWHYDGAFDGNVAQFGWIDFGGSTATSISFDLVLGFGSSENEAATAADATLDSDLSAVETAYNNGWHTYTSSLTSLDGLADDQFYLATMTLKTCQDKSTGAMIAGAGIPWGEVRDNPVDFYAYVWSRDLFKFASSLLAAGDKASARRAVDFLFNRQMQGSGRFPQKTFVDGRVEWDGTQMDQTAMPIILAWKVRQAGELDLSTYWPKIQKAANYLRDNGPFTPLDRWEEVGGHSPSTIAAEIAGLVCAGNLALDFGDPNAQTYFSKADEWRNNVSNWTFTKTGALGNKKYYIRITANQDPDDDAKITLGNRVGDQVEKNVIDGGFLELVRMGAMSPNDWTILETIPEYDATLKQSISGHDAFFRYNYDGYGENNDGTSYQGGGRGRLWPIFTAERGIYEIAKSGNGSAGGPYQAALKAFSSPAGFIPEQVWNRSANITGWQTDTPPAYTPGTATRSIRPLNWAMGEYINLLVAMHSQRSDAPTAVLRRYDTDKPQAHVTFNVRANTNFGEEVYLVGDHPLLSEWIPEAGIKMSSSNYPVWSVKVSLPASRSLHYKYVKRGRGAIQWEVGTNRDLTTPSTGEKLMDDTFR